MQMTLVMRGFIVGIVFVLLQGCNSGVPDEVIQTAYKTAKDDTIGRSGKAWFEVQNFRLLSSKLQELTPADKANGVDAVYCIEFSYMRRGLEMGDKWVDWTERVLIEKNKGSLIVRNRYMQPPGLARYGMHETRCDSTTVPPL